MLFCFIFQVISKSKCSVCKEFQVTWNIVKNRQDHFEKMQVYCSRINDSIDFSTCNDILYRYKLITKAFSADSSDQTCANFEYCFKIIPNSNSRLYKIFNLKFILYHVPLYVIRVTIYFLLSIFINLLGFISPIFISSIFNGIYTYGKYLIFIPYNIYTFFKYENGFHQIRQIPQEFPREFNILFIYYAIYSYLVYKAARISFYSRFACVCIGLSFFILATIATYIVSSHFSLLPIPFSAVAKQLFGN